MQLVVHAEAQQEIIEAADWYDERAEGLGDDLLARVDAASSFEALAVFSKRCE